MEEAHGGEGRVEEASRCCEGIKLIEITVTTGKRCRRIVGMKVGVMVVPTRNLYGNIRPYCGTGVQFKSPPGLRNM